MDLLTDPDMSTLDKLEALEADLGFDPFIEERFPPEHFFGKNVYVRELRMEKGMMFTGRTHDRDHVFILVSGDVLLWDMENGVRRIAGYTAFEAKAGTKRSFVVFEDCIILTAHYVESEITAENALEKLTFWKRAEYIERRKTQLRAEYELLSEQDGTHARLGLQNVPERGEWAGPDTLPMGKKPVARGTPEIAERLTLEN
jgi:hypothetical protein